jgi:uncharacterized protein YpbB
VSPFAFVFGTCFRSGARRITPPSPNYLPTYLLNRHQAGETIREIASELELSEATVQAAILEAIGDLYPRR